MAILYEDPCFKTLRIRLEGSRPLQLNFSMTKSEQKSCKSQNAGEQIKWPANRTVELGPGGPMGPQGRPKGPPDIPALFPFVELSLFSSGGCTVC